MTIKDWFAVGIRITGLVACLRGCEDFIWVIMANLGYNTSVTADSISHVPTLVIGLFYFFSGFYLLRGAQLLIDFAFPAKFAVSKVETVETQEIEESIN